MQEAQAVIERIRRISPTLQRLEVAVDRAHLNVSAGQLLLARTTESLDPYLREPWIPLQRFNINLLIDRPVSRVYTPGQVVSLLGPIGKPIPFPYDLHTLLLIAYEATPASLLMLAQTALLMKASVTLALIGSAGYYPLDVLPQEIEVIRIDSIKNWPNYVKTLNWANQIVAVAPPPIDAAFYAELLDGVRQARIEPPSDFVYGLFQPPMPCGIGACGACSVRCAGEEVLTCLDGPALDLKAVNFALPGER